MGGGQRAGGREEGEASQGRVAIVWVLSVYGWGWG